MANTSLCDFSSSEKVSTQKTAVNSLFNSLIENNEKIIALLQVGIECNFSEKPASTAYHYLSVLEEFSCNSRKLIDLIFSEAFGQNNEQSHFSVDFILLWLSFLFPSNPRFS